MWLKKGTIFSVQKPNPWMRTHAALPFADKIDRETFRIYFSTRDAKNRASTGYVDATFNEEIKIRKISKKPVLSYGKTGSFDENGVMSSCVVNHRQKKFMYYTGWSPSASTPFQWSIGLAISHDDGDSFEKYSEGPIISRNPHDPYFVASPTVVRENNVWKMWYISTKGWKKQGRTLIAPYFLKYAESKNGIDWNINDHTAIDIKKGEIGLGRASILKEDGKYKMWYSYFKERYQIGYAESKDGKAWKRDDKTNIITASKSGWDSESVEYPFVFSENKRKIMLYNGNGYGRTGFGYAVFEP